jgi:thymidylate kinase
MEENSEVLHLKALLSFLEQENIEYCIVGNTMGFPDEIHGDVDIVVQPKQIAQLNVFLFDFAKNRNIRIVQVFQHEQAAWDYVFFWFEDNCKLKFLSIDICGDYFWNGYSLISANVILKDRILKKSNTSKKISFYTPTPEKAFIYYLVKKVLKQEFTYKQKKYLKAEWDRDSIGCKRQIKRFWTEKETNKIVWALETDNCSALNDLIPGLNKSLRKNLNFSIFHFSEELKRLIQRILKPTGLFVAFIGPDGSGKSSIIENILNDLMPAFRNIYVYHLRPNLSLRNAKFSEPVKNPHGKAPRGQLSSLLKIFYYFIDYSIGYVLKIWPLITRSTLVIFDRYYHDLLVDPNRFRYGGPMRVVQSFSRIVPTPKLVILLDAPAEVLQSRKKEVSYAEAARQREAYLKLVGNMNKGIIIDASQSLNTVIRTTIEVILQLVEQRAKKRFR